VGSAQNITRQKNTEEDLRYLSGQLLRLQDEERRRIARGLHDSTGQDLVALATTLGQLRNSLPTIDRKSRDLFAECKALSDKCIREIRTLSYVLHPTVLDQSGLADAIRDFVDGFTKRTGIRVNLELPPQLGRLARDIELTLYRVVQEALTNIQRHSGSQVATVRIAPNSNLTLEVSDRGKGAIAGLGQRKVEARFRIGVGIASMKERVRLVGGRLDIESGNEGTTVRATIPLEGSHA
jgi:signal transduction histidine kinase